MDKGLITIIISSLLFFVGSAWNNVGSLLVEKFMTSQNMWKMIISVTAMTLVVIVLCVKFSDDIDDEHDEHLKHNMLFKYVKSRRNKNGPIITEISD